MAAAGPRRRLHAGSDHSGPGCLLRLDRPHRSRPAPRPCPAWRSSERAAPRAAEQAAGRPVVMIGVARPCRARPWPSTTLSRGGTADIAEGRSGSLRVVLDTGFQYPPASVFLSPAAPRFVDQFGGIFTDPAAPATTSPTPSPARRCERRAAYLRPVSTHPRPPHRGGANRQQATRPARLSHRRLSGALTISRPTTRAPKPCPLCPVGSPERAQEPKRQPFSPLTTTSTAAARGSTLGWRPIHTRQLIMLPSLR